jgi:hypothetical protein
MCQFFHNEVELIYMDSLPDAGKRAKVSKLQFCNVGDWKSAPLTSGNQKRNLGMPSGKSSRANFQGDGE